MSIRSERVASLLKEELGVPARTRVRRGGARVHHGHRGAADRRTSGSAKIFVSVFGAPELRQRTMAFLEAETPHIRSLLAGRMRLRFMPALQFVLDDTLDRVDRINTLIKKIHDDDDPGSGDTGS